MRIAVAYESGNVFAHFGRTGQFKIYEIEDGQVTATRVVGTGGQGHGALTDVLRALGADTLICGGIGSGARMALAAAGIRLYGGVSGSADAAVQSLLDGNLSYDPQVRCDHHGRDQEHDCGNHACAQDHQGCAGNH